MNHFMCDLETMGLRDNSVIVSIGIVEFDETSLGRQFYVNVSKESCLEHGLVTDQSTVNWWDQQSEEAKSAWQRDPVHLIHALSQLNRFFEQGTGGFAGMRIWGNGAGFDNVLLKNAYRAVEADEPWKYYHNRCYRTMANVFPLAEPVQRVGTYHNALDDAITQALTLQAICKQYSIKLF